MSILMTASEAWRLASSKERLERDQAAERIHREGLQGQLLADIGAMLADRAKGLADDNANHPWEVKLGFLTLSEAVISMPEAATRAECLLAIMPDVCLHLLTDREARVRTAAGKAMGALCRLRGPAAYEGLRGHVLASVRADLEREAPPSNRAEAAGLFHDTAGWRNLETSLAALKEMAVGCGHAFEADDELMPVLVAAVAHDNR